MSSRRIVGSAGSNTKGDRMDILIKYALSWLGVPYIWGGQSRGGVDCSGLVQCILQSVGSSPHGDYTSHGLYLHFLEHGELLSEPKEGAICFYGTSERMIHVAFCVDDWRIIEAGSGNSRIRTVEDAKASNAFVRIRPVAYRKDLYAIVMPKYRF